MRGDGDHDGHEVSGDDVGETSGSARGCAGLRRPCDDLRQQGFDADAVGAHHERAGAVDGGAGDCVPGASRREWTRR